MNKLVLLLALFIAQATNAQTTGARVVVQVGHNPGHGHVHGGVFSPDSQLLLTSDETGVFILWNIASGREVRRFTGDPGPPSAIQPNHRILFFSLPSISSDNRYCLLPTRKWGFQLWDVTTGKMVKDFTSVFPTNSVFFQAIFSKDGKYVLGQSGEKGLFQMLLYNIQSGDSTQLIYSGTARPDGKGNYGIFKQPYCIPSSLDVSKDLKTIAIGMVDGRALYFNLPDLKKKGRKGGISMNDMNNIYIDTMFLSEVRFIDEGKLLVCKSNNLVSIWDVKANRMVRSMSIPTHKDYESEETFPGSYDLHFKVVDAKASVLSDDGTRLSIEVCQDVDGPRSLNFYRLPDFQFDHTLAQVDIPGDRGLGYGPLQTPEYSNNRNPRSIANDGNYFSTDNDEVVNAKTGRIEAQLEPRAIFLTNAGFLKGGTEVFFGTVAHNAFIVNFATGKIKTLRTQPIAEDTTGDGRLPYTKLEPLQNGYRNIYVSPDEKIAVTTMPIPGLDTAVKFWNLANGKLIKSVNSSNFSHSLFQIDLSKDQKYLSAPGGIFNLATKAWMKLPLPTSAERFSSDGKTISVAVSIKRDKKTPLYLKTISLSNLKVIKSVELKFTREAEFFPQDTVGRAILSKLRSSERLSDTSLGYVLMVKSRVACWQQHDFVIFDTLGTEQIRIRDPNLQMGDSSALHSETFAGFSDDGDWLAISIAERIYIYNLKLQGKLVWILRGHDEPIYCLCFSPDNQRLVSISRDRTARIWDMTAGTELAMFAAYDVNNYCLKIPGGYYTASPKGARALHFVKDIETYSFDQFDLQYNRPDKVFEFFGLAPQDVLAAYRKAYFKRIERLGFDPANFEQQRSFNIPEVQLVDVTSGRSTSREKTFVFNVQGVDAKYKIDRFNVFVNGVPIFGSRGYDVKTMKSKKLNAKLWFDLTYGENIVEVSCVNEKGIESLTKTFQIDYSEKVVPDLYVVSIGAGTYQAAGMNLRYASKDAIDIIKYFSAAPGYRSIFPIKIIDGDVTKDVVLGVKNILRKARAEDEVIVFYAGHGVFSDSLDYYLGTYDMDFSEPGKRGLAYGELEGLLDSLRARKKVLFLDACHSGEYDKDEITMSSTKKTEFGTVTFTRAGNRSIAEKNLGLENSFQLMQEIFSDLRRSTGASVISSAEGVQLALEGDKWKNGIFTYCLLSGLSEKKADLNKDGKIMLSELQAYVQATVSRLTDGKQTPTSRIENIVTDIRMQ